MDKSPTASITHNVESRRGFRAARRPGGCCVRPRCYGGGCTRAGHRGGPVLVRLSLAWQDSPGQGGPQSQCAGTSSYNQCLIDRAKKLAPKIANRPYNCRGSARGPTRFDLVGRGVGWRSRWERLLSTWSQVRSLLGALNWGNGAWLPPGNPVRPTIQRMPVRHTAGRHAFPLGRSARGVIAMGCLAPHLHGVSPHRGVAQPVDRILPGLGKGPTGVRRWHDKWTGLSRGSPGGALADVP